MESGILNLAGVFQIGILKRVEGYFQKILYSKYKIDVACEF